MTTITTTMDGRVAGTLHRVRGDYLNTDGTISNLAPRVMHVIVDADGVAWPALPEDTAYNAGDHGDLAPLSAEIWGDGIYLGRQFSPDQGELERCGIRFELRGSAAGRA